MRTVIQLLLLISFLSPFQVSAIEKVILDTDPSNDPDDTGCMAMLHGLANAGEVKILAVMNSFHHKESSLCISSINHFYNRRAIPVGDYKYQNKKYAPETNYDFHIATNYPRDLKSDNDAPEAFKLYREILASQSDNSVTIIVVGTMHNMELLFKSTPDEFSALNGIDLVAQKVKKVVTMGGNFINHVGHDRTNWGGSETLCAPERTWACLNPERNAMTRFVIDNCPVPFIASGWENGNGEFNNAGQGNVITGQGLKKLDKNHIVRQAYEHHFATRGGSHNIERHSNDQCALLYAVKGAGSWYNTFLNGQIVLTSNGSCLWNPDINNKAGYIKKKSIDPLVEIIEHLMLSPVVAADKTPPAPVSNMALSANDSSIILKWDTVSEETVGSWIAYYNIYRDGKLIGKAHGARFVDRNLQSGSLKYAATAVNVNGIESKKSSIAGTVEFYEHSPHFVIKSKAATFYYDIPGGGFSRIIDRNGNDWVSFKREPWGQYPASAASSFRGLPNAVWQGEDDGAGHPGHKKCISWLQNDKITTESLSGKWTWQWTFFKEYAQWDVLKTDTTRQYWFLYEGTPAGRFDPSNSYYGTSNGGPNTDQPDYYNGGIRTEHFQWLYVGHQNTKRVFYMLHIGDDELTDMISYLGNNEDGAQSLDGMTVHAFGRNVKPEPLFKGPHSFIIGFYPGKIKNSVQHDKFVKFLNEKFNRE